MKKLLNLLFIVGILVICAGCSQNNYFNKDSYIQSKSKINDSEYYYIIRNDRYFDIRLTLPDNFGNVGDKITITNGIHAWPSK